MRQSLLCPFPTRAPAPRDVKMSMEEESPTDEEAGIL